MLYFCLWEIEDEISNGNERTLCPDHRCMSLSGLKTLSSMNCGSTENPLFPLKWSAKLQAGETVLINGATGFAGKLAVQVARLLGAKRVIGTGRDAVQLAKLRDLGADAVIDLKQSDANVVEAFKQEAGASGYQIILDFVWGHPTELLLETLIPRELSLARQRVRLVQIGEMAGPTISLAAAALRTSELEILGAGSGSSSMSQVLLDALAFLDQPGLLPSG